MRPMNGLEKNVQNINDITMERQVHDYSVPLLQQESSSKAAVVV